MADNLDLSRDRSRGVDPNMKTAVYFRTIT